MSILYKALERMIQRGQLAGIETKIDIFFAASKITQEEYLTLMALLPQPEQEPEQAPEQEPEPEQEA